VLLVIPPDQGYGSGGKAQGGIARHRHPGVRRRHPRLVL